MENSPTTVAAGTAPADANTETTAPSPAPKPSEKPTAKEILAALPPDQRRLAALGKFEQIKAPAPAAVEPAAAPAPVTPETPGQEQPAAPEGAPETAPTVAPDQGAPEGGDDDGNSDEAAAAAADPNSEKSKRFRISGEENQAILLISKSKGISIREATKIFEGTLPTPPVEAAQTPPAQAAPRVQEDAIAKQQQLIKDLTEQRKKANEDLDSDRVLELSDQIADARGEIKVLESEKRSSRRTYQEQVNEARNRVLAEYEPFAKTDSMERLALDAYVQRAIDDPARRGEFNDPAWPEKIAREFAKKQGIKTKAGPASTTPTAPTNGAPKALPKAQPQQIAAPNGARLLTGSDGRTSSAPRPLTRDDALTLVRTNPEARKAIVRSFGKTSPGVRR